MPRHMVCTLIALLAATVLYGCDRAASPPGAKGARSEPGRRRSVVLRRTPVEGAEKEAAIEMVKRKPVDNGAQMVREWAEEQLEPAEGDALFPMWSAVRTQPQQYEVRFTYTLVKRDNEIIQKGYVWPVDAMLHLVGERRELSAEELAGSEFQRRMYTPEPRGRGEIDLE